MPINFFDKELSRLQDRFNSTFGVMTVCDLKARGQTILAIVGLGVLAKKINTTTDKDQVRAEISRFVKGRDTLNRWFDHVQSEITKQHERRTRHGEALQMEPKNRQMAVR